MAQFLTVAGAVCFVLGMISSVFIAIGRSARNPLNGQDMVDKWLGEDLSHRMGATVFLLVGGLMFIVGIAMKAIP